MASIGQVASAVPADLEELAASSGPGGLGGAEGDQAALVGLAASAVRGDPVALAVPVASAELEGLAASVGRAAISGVGRWPGGPGRRLAMLAGSVESAGQAELVVSAA